MDRGEAQERAVRGEDAVGGNGMDVGIVVDQLADDRTPRAVAAGVAFVVGPREIAEVNLDGLVQRRMTWPARPVCGFNWRTLKALKSHKSNSARSLSTCVGWTIVSTAFTKPIRFAASVERPMQIRRFAAVSSQSGPRFCEECSEAS